MKRRIKRWSLPPRKPRRIETGHLVLAGVAGALLLGLSIWIFSAGATPEEMVVDAGPAEPPCPYLVRLNDREQRCDPDTLLINQPQIAADLLMPAMPEGCRPIVSDTKGKLYPLTFESRGSGLRGSIGPLPESATTYTLRFVAWDERIAKDQACLQWASYRIKIQRPPPPTDAGPAADVGTQ